MIVQITQTRNELYLIKEMLPIWKKYADGFVFLDDCSDDGTYEFLTEHKDEYNVLAVIKTDSPGCATHKESHGRQRLFDEALKHSGNIICMDSDEYLDGNIQKDELEYLMESSPDTLIYLRWIQYTGKNKIRVDGPWRENYKDRVGSYSKATTFKDATMHAEHMPHPGKHGMIRVPDLFIAHLQWLDNPTVAVKQYFWKIADYVNNKKYGIQTTPASAYDESVANFEWEYEDFSFPLKVNPEIYATQNIEDSYKHKFIKDSIKEYNIPNLNDWGMNIHDSN
jgi:hypothetical protein